MMEAVVSATKRQQQEQQRESVDDGHGVAGGVLVILLGYELALGQRVTEMPEVVVDRLNVV